MDQFTCGTDVSDAGILASFITIGRAHSTRAGFDSIEIRTDNEAIDRPSLERAVKVQVAPFHATGQFLSKNWQWVAGTIVLPLAVWAISHTNPRRAIRQSFGVKS